MWMGVVCGLVPEPAHAIICTLQIPSTPLIPLILKSGRPATARSWLALRTAMRDDPSVPHQTFALGSLAEALPDVAVIDLGPDHPTRAGLVRIRLRHNNSTVYAADVQPGALHRGAEMIFEVREYRQLLSLANRHDWQAPFFGELLIARLVEESLGIATSQRVRWLRVLLAEHFRIISHVAYLSFVEITLKGDLGGSRHARANLLERSLELTGNRVHPMVVRLGGSAADLTPGWAQRERHALDEVRGGPPNWVPRWRRTDAGADWR